VRGLSTLRFSNSLDALDIDEISVELAPNLVSTVMGEDFGFDQRIQKIRKFVTMEYGFILPSIRLTDNALLADDTYKIKVQGTVVATQTLKPNQLLVLIEPEEHAHIPGFNTREPVFQEERISIRNMPLILELIAEGKAALNSTEQLADFVRHRMSYQFISKLRDDKGRLPLVQIGPNWETQFQTNESVDESGRRDMSCEIGSR